jgi:hypothetical protein
MRCSSTGELSPALSFRGIFCLVGSLVRFVSFRFVSFRFVSFRFVSFRFVSFRFVSFRFVSCRKNISKVLVKITEIPVDF